ncbi:11854_t:CDS:2 [Racocetra persica]|uniref:11854_t:CDS:1 n=1 Tax=Racocetra persica TaxID=160502 RepID=A0ACA9KAX1_9GLOM|nr:11854_t:CDS:2 [Racocetra persica]
MESYQYPNYETHYPVRTDNEFTNNAIPTKVQDDTNNNHSSINFYEVPIKSDIPDNEVNDTEKAANKTQHEKVISKDAVKWYRNTKAILGIVFLAGSWPRKRRESVNAHLSTQLWVSTSASTLALAVLALVTPAAFKIAAPAGTGIECDIQNISHATALILLLVYVGLLIFQLKTHANEVVDDSEEHQKRAQYFLIYDVFLVGLSVFGITLCARYLVTSIEHLAHNFKLGNGFIGMVLIPLCVVSNFMEHYDAIKEASKDKVDRAVSLVLNTSVQIALLIGPVLVLGGWATSRPLTLDFNVLEICVLACAVLIVNYLVADGKANWLEGYMLIMSYVMIAVAFFYLPDIPDLPENTNCNPWSRNLPPDSSTIKIEDLVQH